MAGLTVEQHLQGMLQTEDERLRPIVARAYQEPVLRALYPFASLSDLRFSTRPEYDARLPRLPHISCWSTGEYVARDADNRPIVIGTLDVVVAAVVSAMVARA